MTSTAAMPASTQVTTNSQAAAEARPKPITRNPLRALTPRGYGMLAAGIALLVVALVLRQRDFAWLGLAAIALVPLSLLMAWLPLGSMTTRRSLLPSRVGAGEEAIARVEVVREKSGLPHLLQFEEALPKNLGTRPRFSAALGFGPFRRSFEYPITSNRRGRFHIGPLLVRGRDPFGLAKIDRYFRQAQELMVTPRVYPIGPRGGGSAGASDESTMSHAGLVGQDDVLIRDYRPGDDVRRIHWRSTAHTGSLMVRREEQSWDPRVRVLLDTRASAHVGDDVTGSFEWAVSAAASVAIAFIKRGFSLELVNGDGARLIIDTNTDREDAESRVLEALTDIQTSSTATIAEFAPVSHLRSPEQLIVAIVGKIDGNSLDALAEMRHGSTPGIAIVLDTPAFQKIAKADRSAATAAVSLDDLGWTTALALPGADVTAVWDNAAKKVQI